MQPPFHLRVMPSSAWRQHDELELLAYNAWARFSVNGLLGAAGGR